MGNPDNKNNSRKRRNSVPANIRLGIQGKFKFMKEKVVLSHILF